MGKHPKSRGFKLSEEEEDALEMTGNNYLLVIGIDDYIAYAYLLKVIRALKAQHVVFIVDSCYSGAAMVRAMDTASHRLYKNPSRWLLASGRNEVVPDGDTGGHSPFAEQLLDVFIRNEGKPLRMGTLVENVITSVTNNSHQTPIGRPIFQVGDKGGEFVFIPKEMAINFNVKKTKTDRENSLLSSSTHMNDLIHIMPPMVFIEGGTFTMGNNEGNDNEIPAHTVKIDNFEIAKYLVTQDLWQQVMGENPSRSSGDALHPIEFISWEDCQKFIKKINNILNSNYRLPTEAEWEFAARGGNYPYKQYNNTGFRLARSL